jgi:hypothetical protein
MIHNIPEPELSPNFTIEDIHKIRDWNYERLKDATTDEWLADIHKQAESGLKELEAVKNRNAVPA